MFDEETLVFDEETPVFDEETPEYLMNEKHYSI